MAMRPMMFVGFLALLISDGFVSPAHSSPGHMKMCEREMRMAAARHGVPLGMLYSVGLTETGQKGSLHPYALNIDGKAVFANSRAEAKRKFDAAKASGVRLIDVGCMQINHHFHGEKFRNVDQMFEPRYNVEYAARFLKELKQKHDTWTMAVARYHAGPNNNPAHKRYVCRVISNMVATGFGNWTPKARQLCAS